MTTNFRFMISRVMLAVVGAGCVGLLSGAVLAQGIGMPGVGAPGAGIGNPAMNLPQRQGPMVGGIGGGAPGQMNPRIGGARPGQMPGFTAPGGGGGMGGPRSGSQFAGLAQRGGAMFRSGQAMTQNSRNAARVGIPGARRGNR
jgi:hypothetical protein